MECDLNELVNGQQQHVFKSKKQPGHWYEIYTLLRPYIFFNISTKYIWFSDSFIILELSNGKTPHRYTFLHRFPVTLRMRGHQECFFFHNKPSSSHCTVNPVHFPCMCMSRSLIADPGSVLNSCSVQQRTELRINPWPQISALTDAVILLPKADRCTKAV